MATHKEIPGRSFIAQFGISLFTAFFICILEVIFVLAFTALIYSGDLTSEIPRAMGFVLMGDAVMCAVIASLSSYKGFIGVEQDVPGAMQGVVAFGIMASLAGSISAQFATVTLMIVTTTLLTGLMLLLMGYFKLGGIARFLPYPVIGGFLAGTGWLLIQGGVGIMTDLPLGWEWFSLHAIQLWIPGLLLGLIIYFASHRFNKPYTIPLVIFIATILFYGFVWVEGAAVSELRQAGWLLDTRVSTTLWEFPLSRAFLSEVDWAVLLRQIPSLIPIAFISVISLMLNSSGMELIIKRDIDLNRELMVAGAGNLSGGLVGGLVGFQDISLTSLNRSMSGGRRMVGLLVAVLLAATILVGTTSLIYIPKFIFGSVLIYLGFELLIHWVYQSWFKFSRIDFLVVVTILATLAVRGVMESVVVGLVTAVVMFAVSYSRVSVVKFALSGREYRSRVTRSSHELQILDRHGDRLFIMKLEGFIFFGTANNIFVTVRERIKASGGITYCLLDFSKVSGIDSTGMLSFNRMIQWNQELGITLVLSGLDEKMRAEFMRDGAGYSPDTIKFLPNLDRALEWCENGLIASNLGELNGNMEIVNQLNGILKISSGAEMVLPYFQRREYKQGEYLIKEGDTPDLIYFVHAGRLTAQLESLGREPIRLETMNSGRTVGELGFYLGTKRTASVIADEDSVVYSLSTEDLKQMEAESPEAASTFHRLNTILLSERVSHLIRTVRALERA